MQIELITEGIWKRLTAASKKKGAKAIVAVAYFSQDAASMLPLQEGSILLVDASEQTVSAGSTCPAELLKLYYKGVKIYSKDWLHAKMFILDHSLYIGSTNVSVNSTRRTEAIVKISHNKSVTDAKRFIKSFCKIELGEAQLKELQKKYRKPRFSGLGGRKKRNMGHQFVNGKAFYIYHLDRIEFTKDEEKQSKIGYREAAVKRINKTRHIIEEFKWPSHLPAIAGDVVMQIVDEGTNYYVSPPGVIIHQRRWKNKDGNKTLTYLEVPTRRRKNLNFVKSKLNQNEKKLVKRNGARSTALAEKLTLLWN